MKEKASEKALEGAAEEAEDDAGGQEGMVMRVFAAFAVSSGGDVGLSSAAPAAASSAMLGEEDEEG